MIRYKPCEDSPDREHSFTGIDDRCMWCDAKPWYRSIREETDTVSDDTLLAQAARVRPAGDYVCVCGHAVWLHRKPPVKGQPWGDCRAIDHGTATRCACVEAWPMEDQPRPCVACWTPAAEGSEYCVGHDRLMTYTPPTQPDEDGPYGAGFAANE